MTPRIISTARLHDMEEGSRSHLLLAPGVYKPDLLTHRMTVFHLAEASDTSGYFFHFAKWRDRSLYRMIFGTLRPMDLSLAERMREQGVECFSCGCSSRRNYPSALVRLALFLRRRRVDI